MSAMTTFQNPDNPYTTECGFKGDGSFVIAVSTEVLAGDDESTAEVRAECARRAEALQRALLSMLP